MKFIIDVNLDMTVGSKNYPHYFMNDLVSSKAIKILRGGSKYEREMARKQKLVALMVQLANAGKVERVDTRAVDKCASDMKLAVEEKLGFCPGECDDFHLLALAKLGGGKNVVTRDKRMGECVKKTRKEVGHKTIPTIKLIRTEAVYRKLWK